MDVRTVPAHLSPARDLIEAMVAELVPLYGRIDGPDAPSATPEDFAAPHGAFVVLFDSGGPVAGGGIKRLDEGIAEIKRMYVVPQARGRGHGRTLLEALEAEARRLGYTHARLDTGVHQPQAQKLYESAGYVAIEDYNANPHASYWGEKALGS